MAASQSRMNILKLPLELRELIYRPVLIDHADWNGRVHIPMTPGSSSWGSSSSSWDSTFPMDSLRTPALLQTCQQIRRDTEALYYSTTEFATPWSLHDFYFAQPADIAHRWLRHIGPRCRSMIKSFVIEIEHGYDDDELMRRMEYMANEKKNQEYDNPYGLLPEIIAFPRKLRTTVEWILEHIELDTDGLEEGVVEVRFPIPRGQSGGVREVMSNSEVFCPFCYGYGEPDSAEFLGGVCVDCPESRAEGDMQVGSWMLFEGRV